MSDDICEIECGFCAFCKEAQQQAEKRLEEVRRGPQFAPAEEGDACEECGQELTPDIEVTEIFSIVRRTVICKPCVDRQRESSLTQGNLN